jgi:hypothetical protein
MNHVSEQFDWSFMSVFGCLLGYLLHITMSYGEWKKISKQPDLTFRCFVTNDLSSQLTGLILVIFVYCSLSVLSQLDFLKAMFGFTPKVDFFGAFMTAFASQGIGIKLANMLKNMNSSG